MARLLDYFGRRTNWQRRLWNPGTVTVLQETLEAVDLLASGHRGEAVKEPARMAQRRSGPDRGLGTSADRSALAATLRQLQESPGSLIARHQLDQLLTSITKDYLARWSRVLSSDPNALAPEAASGTLGGHLLGLGFSSDYLHRWATWLAKQRRPASLAQVFREAEEVTCRQPRRWEVLVPFIALARHSQQMPPEWLDAGEQHSGCPRTRPW